MFNFFKTSESEKRLLVDRAQWLGNGWVQTIIENDTDGIIRILNYAAENRFSPFAKKLDSEDERQVFIEMLAFHLHCADRAALETLGVKKRDIFMEALFKTSLSAAVKSKRGDSTIEIIFYDFYAGFELEYCNLEYSPKIGGLFHQFSNRLSAIANSEKGPIENSSFLLKIQGLLVRWAERLCLSTFVNPRKSFEDWQEETKEVDEIISKFRSIIKQSETKTENDETAVTGAISETTRIDKSDSKSQSELPRMHHYNFAYKALPGLAFADPRVPLGFGNDVPKGSLIKFWDYVGSKLPEDERGSSIGLGGTGGPYGVDHSTVFITMPRPERKTEAYYVAIVYPRAWFNSPAHENSNPPAPYPVFFLLTVSDVPGSGGVAGATLRILTKEGHGAVAFGVSVSEEAFMDEIEKIMGADFKFITFVQSKLWNFFMQDGETGETFGSD